MSSDSEMNTDDDPRLLGSSTFELRVEEEVRIAVADYDHLKVELVEGYAEIAGAELERNRVYTYPPLSSFSLFTWKGCVIKISGVYFPKKIKYASDSMIVLLVTFHACLEEARIVAAEKKTRGPVSLVVGPTDVGKTTFCQFLCNYAARQNRRPIYIDLDVSRISKAMPGTINVLPIEGQSDIVEGFDEGSLYPFGYNEPGFNIFLYCLLIKRLGELSKTWMNNDANTQASGMVIDTCGWVREDGYRAITLAALSFEIDNVFVIDDEELYEALKRDMPSSVQVVYCPKQHGVREAHDLRKSSMDKHAEEYFYGKELDMNPYKLKVKFSDVSIYTVETPSSEPAIDPDNVTANDIKVIKVKFGPHLENSILALSAADEGDENLMMTYVMGFVCVSSIDMEKEIMCLLSPGPGPLRSKILILMGGLRLNEEAAKCTGRDFDSVFKK